MTNDTDINPDALRNRMRRMIERPGVSEEHKQAIGELLHELDHGYMPDVLAIHEEYEAILDEMGVPK